MEGSFSNPGYFTFDLIEEGRREIFKWSEKRRSKRAGLQGTLYKVTKLFITRSVSPRLSSYKTPDCLIFLVAGWANIFVYNLTRKTVQIYIIYWIHFGYIVISAQLNKFGLLLLRIYNYVILSNVFNYLRTFVSINV